ncbi:hypothetical protein [Candidatus Williamhamiltonella defendens]|uniref:hypothetical protein n=1 Tax=Candidatus Williamhamiltonella defendens TaxID=138072 RepID=UPI001F2ADA76|nr:hypothetical protein [Candidatus Hamiltonella defensa]
MINVANRRYRLNGMQEGEVVLYTDKGNSMRAQMRTINRDGDRNFCYQCKNKVVLNTQEVET